MPRQPNRDRSKLPEWAQQEIQTLEANIRYRDRRIQQGMEAESGKPETFSFESPGFDGNDVGIPGDKITAHFGEGSSIDIRFEKDRPGKKPLLYLSCGGEYMCIYPSSSNVLKVKPVFWQDLP